MAGLTQNIVTDEQENKVAVSVHGSAVVVVVVVLKLVKCFNDYILGKILINNFVSGISFSCHLLHTLQCIILVPQSFG